MGWRQGKNGFLIFDPAVPGDTTLPVGVPVTPLQPSGSIWRQPGEALTPLVTKSDKAPLRPINTAVYPMDVYSSPPIIPIQSDSQSNAGSAYPAPIPRPAPPIPPIPMPVTPAQPPPAYGRGGRWGGHRGWGRGGGYDRDGGGYGHRRRHSFGPRPAPVPVPPTPAPVPVPVTPPPAPVATGKTCPTWGWMSRDNPDGSYTVIQCHPGDPAAAGLHGLGSIIDDIAAPIAATLGPNWLLYLGVGVAAYFLMKRR